jgi:photosystem II stability/assembly factor-like uncharacterized protein
MDKISRIVSLVVFVISFLPSPSLKGQWQRTSGPAGPFGGDITAITASSSGTLFAISRDVGLFRSTDHGANWIVLNTGLSPDYHLNSVTCADSDYVYLSTSVGLFRSSDDGLNWRVVLSNAISCVTLTSKGTIVAGDQYYPLCYRSTDQGANWGTSDTIPAIFGIISLASKVDGNIFLVTQQHGVFRSTTDGQSWSSIRNGFVVPTIGARRLNGGPIYVAPNGEIFCIMNDLVYRSSNNGDSWNLMSLDIIQTPTGQQYANNYNVFLMTEDGCMFVGSHTSSDGVRRSTDNDSSWTQVNEGITDLWIECIAADLQGNLYVGSGGGGVFKSANQGDGWSASNVGLSRSDVQTLAKNSTGDLFAGTAEGGLYRTTDQGQTWLSVNNGIDIMNVTAIVIDKNDVLFAGTKGAAGMYRSADNGGQWHRSNAGLADSNVITMAMDSNGTMFTSTEGGLFVSTNSGATWQPAGSGLTSEVYALDCSISERLYAATKTGVSFSKNSGKNWTACSNGLPNGAVLSITFLGNSLIAGTGASGIYCSTDSGASWCASNAGLTANSVQFISVNAIKKVFACTKNGIYVSADNGATWGPVNQGLTYMDVRSMVFDCYGYAYAATYGGGVFKTTESTTAVNGQPTELLRSFCLMQNYPNPFNPSTVITYQLATNTFVTLRVYDMLGRAVKTLVNRRQSSGYHSVILDAGSLPSGVYFYRLQTETFANTKKLILLR